MAQIAKKGKVNNNIGLLKVVDGVNKKDVVSITDFGRFFVVILKDSVIVHFHVGYEARFKRWGGVDINGEALQLTTYSWLENLVEAKNEAKGKENELYPGTDVTYNDVVDSMVIITEANLSHTLTAFADADEAAKFAKERLDYLERMGNKLQENMNTPVAEETEDDLKKNFEHSQKAIIAEEAAKVAETDNNPNK